MATELAKQLLRTEQEKLEKQIDSGRFHLQILSDNLHMAAEKYGRQAGILKDAEERLRNVKSELKKADADAGGTA
jgi:hypothetical protein